MGFKEGFCPAHDDHALMCAEALDMAPFLEPVSFYFQYKDQVCSRNRFSLVSGGKGTRLRFVFFVKAMTGPVFLVRSGNRMGQELPKI